MSIVGLTQAEQDHILRMLAAILWIGNVEFKVDQEGNSQVKDSSVTAFVAYLLEVDQGRVEKALTSRVMETQRGGRRGEYQWSLSLAVLGLDLTEAPFPRFRLRSPSQSCTSYLGSGRSR